MNITVKEIDNATVEAIYWWNRDEYYYHRYFSKLDKIYDDKTVLDFFTQKIFEVFLKEYGIRRNLSSGYGSVVSFIEELHDNDFFINVAKGNTEIIDVISPKIKASGKSTKRNTKSLLSKVAFLINPHVFSLSDTLTRESIRTLTRNEILYKKGDIDNSYSCFLKQTNLLRIYLMEKYLFQHSREILTEFAGTESYRFFSENNDAFEMRIVDKYLWLLAQTTGRFDNSGYKGLIKLGL